MAKLGKILHVFVFFLKLFAVIMSRVTKAQFLWKGLFGICRQAKAVSAQYAIENLSNCTILILLQSIMYYCTIVLLYYPYIASV